MVIEADIEISVKAKLVLKTDGGIFRDATMEDLKGMGFQHKSALYERTRHMFELIGLDIDDDHDDSSDHMTILRYFIDYITQGYDWDPDDDDIERMRVRLNPKSS